MDKAIGDKMLDVWFCQSMTSFLKLGPSKASQIMKLVSKALELLPELGSLHPAVVDLLSQPVRILRTTMRCLACLCRPIPGACGSSVDDVLEIVGSVGKNVHLWQMSVKNLLEQPGGAWSAVVFRCSADCFADKGIASPLRGMPAGCSEAGLLMG